MHKLSSCCSEVFKDELGLREFFRRDFSPCTCRYWPFPFFLHFFNPNPNALCLPYKPGSQPRPWRAVSFGQQRLPAVWLPLFISLHLRPYHDKSSWNGRLPVLLSYNLRRFFPLLQGKEGDKLLSFLKDLCWTLKTFILITSFQMSSDLNIWKINADKSFLVRGLYRLFPVMESAFSFNTWVFLLSIFCW